ncbi:phage terminase large subunit [Rhodospirillaceae bacterium AH-315-P19]|nr:phage terminase large subunit [Rhodospirillaceae bacterium AH-315-P19]
MNELSRVFQATLRSDLSSFIQKCFSTVDPAATYLHNWHIDAIAWHLEECRRGNIRRLLITMPPRYLKSIAASVAFPAWIFGHDPTARIIAVSYSADLSGKHARDCRAIMESDWYRGCFRKTRLHPNKNTESEFMTTAQGFRLATSVGGTLTGRGGKIILIDDPMKPGEAMSATKREAVKQWYAGTLYSRLDDKANDVIVIIMQRLHVDDLVGHVLEQEDWVHLDLPAIAEIPQRIQCGPGRFITRQPGELLHPEREPQETLDRIKRTLGSYAFSAQYQQQPVPPGGALIHWKWFRRYQEVPAKSGNDRIIQSWDTASKGEEIHDYSVCTTWLEKGSTYYLIDVYRERLEYPALRRRVVELAQKYAADVVIIEDKGSGTHLIQELTYEGPFRPIAFLPEGDKVTRAAAQTAIIEAGNVWLPERAPWLHDFEREVLQFPHGKFDDQVDSFVQFLSWITKQRYLPRWRAL